MTVVRVERVMVALLLLAGCSHVPFDSQPMPKVDAARYMGKWYEIARLPNRFETGCAGITADYSLHEDGTVGVLNTCHKDFPDGPARTSTGKAWVVDESDSRLLVSFWWPFKAPYWIIDLDPEYRWAAVGHPKHKYLWILSREKTLPASVEEGLLARLKALGYDTVDLVRPRQ